MLQDQDEDKLLFKGDLKKLRPFKGYILVAWKLAKARKKDAAKNKEHGVDNVKNFKTTKPYVDFNKSTRDLIDQISEKILGMPKFDETQEVPIKKVMNNEQLRTFFASNEIAAEILSDKDLVYIINKNIKVTKRLNQAVKWLKNSSEMVHNASYIYHFPPVEWILATLYGALNLSSRALLNFSSQFNPDVEKQKKLEGYAASAGLAGVIAVVGFGLSFAAGSAATVAAPILIAIGTLSLMVSNMLSFVAKTKNLITEIRDNKEPKETYALRVFQRSLNCFKYALSSVFYACLTLLAVAAVVAIFSNPIGLAALAGAIASVAIAVVVVSIATVALRQFAKWRIKKIEEKHLPDHEKTTLDNKLKIKGKKIVKHLKELRSRKEQTDELDDKARRETIITRVDLKANEGVVQSRSLPVLASGSPKGWPPPKDIHAIATIPVTKQQFEALSKTSLQTLAQKTNPTSIYYDPLYQGVKSQMRSHAKDQPDTLVIKVPRVEAVSTAISVLQDTMVDKLDEIKRYQNHNHEIEVTLTQNPSDKAIYILFDLNRGLAPFEMQPCGDAITALKIFEASKLMNVEVELHPKDRELLLHHPDPKIGAYFTAIEGLSHTEFKNFVTHESKDKEPRKLGEIPLIIPVQQKGSGDTDHMTAH